MNGNFLLSDLVPGCIGAALTQFPNWKNWILGVTPDEHLPSKPTWRHIVWSLLVLAIGGIAGLFGFSETMFDSLVIGYVVANLAEGAGNNEVTRIGTLKGPSCTVVRIMRMLIGFAAILFLTGTIIDRLVKSESIFQIRRQQSNSLRPLFEHNVVKLILATHSLFCDLFDAVYGQRLWSVQRLSRSIGLTTLFILFSILVIGVENTIFYNWGLFENPMAFIFSEFGLVILAILSVNFIADFFSLQETRWVLGRVRGHGVFSLCIWMSIDLFLTTIIYLAVFFIPAAFLYFMFIDPNLTFQHFLEIFFNEIAPLLWDAELFLPFFVSTFGTSIAVFLFVSCAVTINLLRKKSPVLRIAVEFLARTASPARSTACVLSILFFLIYCLYLMIFSWLAN